MIKPILKLVVLVLAIKSCAAIVLAKEAVTDPALDSLNVELSQANLPLLSSRYFTSSSGQTLHYVEGGEGPLLVFYHGFPSFWYMWKYQILAFADSYRIIAIDGLGSNLSDKPTIPAPYKIENLAKQLAELIDHERGTDKAVLIGHDWGGALAWATAQEYPEGLQKLVVFNAPPYNLFLELLATDPNQREASKYVPRLQALSSSSVSMEQRLAMWQLASGNHLTRKTISQKDSDLFKFALTKEGAIRGAAMWYTANLPNFDTIANNDFWPSRDATTAVSALLFWGNEDRTFVEEFITRLPDYATGPLKIHRLPGVGHSPQLDAKDEVNKVLKDFFQSK